MNQKTKYLTNRLLAITGAAWMFDAFDVGMLSFVIAALKKDKAFLITDVQAGWIGSTQSIGMAIGALVFGAMADKVGRKNILIITLLLFSIGSGLSAFVGTISLFFILRFFIGMGLGGELPVASTLVSESVPPERRGRIVVLLESFWAVGWILSAIISYYIIPTFGWRIAVILSALPAFYALYLRFSLPDSPKYESVSQAEKKSIFHNMKSVWAKEYSKQTLILWVLWFCVVFSYYGMFLWLPSVMILKGFSLIKSFQYVLIMTLAQLPGYFTAAWFVEKVGRKFVLITYLIGTALSAYFFGTAEVLPLLITAGILLSFFNLGAWGALYAYTPEQYPTVIRGTGAGMAAAVGRVGGILGPLLVGYLVASGSSIGSIFGIFAIAILIGVVAVAFGKETKNTVLE